MMKANLQCIVRSDYVLSPDHLCKRKIKCHYTNCTADQPRYEYWDAKLTYFIFNQKPAAKYCDKSYNQDYYWHHYSQINGFVRTE